MSDIDQLKNKLETIYHYGDMSSQELDIAAAELVSAVAFYHYQDRPVPAYQDPLPLNLYYFLETCGLVQVSRGGHYSFRLIDRAERRDQLVDLITHSPTDKEAAYDRYARDWPTSEASLRG